MDTTSAIVFVVDDDASVRRSLVRLVRSAGWEAEAFDSAQSFLEREPFDGVACIVLDLCMPKMSGQELQDRLRERHSLMPIVFLSGQSDIPTSVAAMKKGAVDFLLKPVDSDSLLRVIGEAMERHAQCLRQAHDMANIGGRLVRLSAREREVLEQGQCFAEVLMLQTGVARQRADRVGSGCFHCVEHQLGAIEARTLLHVEAEPARHRKSERQVLRSTAL
jgi:FixJ family two-component response regulator